jgi:hypothetical protein
MKNSLKVISLAALAMLTLAGCQNAAAPSTPSTSTTTKTDSTTTTETKTDASGEAKKVATPSGVEFMNEVEAAGSRVVTYSVKTDADAAFEAQAKLATDAGWKGSYAGMTAPVKAMGNVTQTFSAGGKILVIAVTADPLHEGYQMVSMTESADPLAN